MNNYIFSQQDPILFQQSSLKPDDDLRMQMERSWAQYQQAHSNPPSPPKDSLGELDNLLKHVNTPVSEVLLKDAEYVELNNAIQQYIQEELMKTVRWKINSNPEAVQKIDRLKALIQNTIKEYESEERRNMQELNDYIKNYSNITFDEYKKIKNNLKHENN